MTETQEPQQENVVHIHLLELPYNLEDQEVQKLVGYLSDSEKQRFGAIGSGKRKIEYLLGHVLARESVCEILNVPMESLSFDFSDDERPRVRPVATSDNQKQTYLSISHKKSWLVVAVSDAPIGIDLEKYDIYHNVEAMAKRVASEEEHKKILSLSPEDQNKYFKKLWTLDEALYKASDEPHRIIEKSTTFRLDENDQVVAKCTETLTQEEREKIDAETTRREVAPVYFSDCVSEWQFKVMEPVEDYVLAIALKGQLAQPLIDTKHINDLILDS